MADKSGQTFEMPRSSSLLADVFSTQLDRDNANREKVVEIPISEISNFPNHPFKVMINDEMMEMAQSVKQHGVLVPGILRPKKDSGYEMISGHRRKMASTLAKQDTPFANKDNNMESLESNTIIYGHNMGTGRTDMFSTLLLYKDFEHYSTNRYIRFDTIHQQLGWWKVFAVIELNANNTEFYCQQIEFHDEDEFMEWTAKAMALSIHSTDVEITPQDHVLTLSTCDRSSYGRSGRLLILAVKTYKQV